jgi:orotidine-5'-phosphate decarboxylase
MSETRLQQVDPDLSARDRLIVALDFDNRKDALEVVDQVGSDVDTFKVGYELFLAVGPEIVLELKHREKKVFLDLKMHDIGATMERAASVIRRFLGVEFLTLQGNAATAKAATAARGSGPPPIFLHVTALSSLDEADLQEQYGITLSLRDFIRNQAQRIIEAGCDGVIASGESVSDLRTYLEGRVSRVPRPYIVVPGIRPTWAPADDHKRFLTPTEAITAGADYLVVGRPITRADDKLGAAKRVLDEIETAQL